MDLFWSATKVSKFCGNLFCSFCVILMTNRPNRHRRRHNLLGGGENWISPSALNEIILHITTSCSCPPAILLISGWAENVTLMHGDKVYCLVIIIQWQVRIKQLAALKLSVMKFKYFTDHFTLSWHERMFLPETSNQLLLEKRQRELYLITGIQTS